jgi:hypothetical protein
MKIVAVVACALALAGCATHADDIEQANIQKKCGMQFRKTDALAK